MTTLQELGIDRMTAAERIALAQEILDTLAADHSPPVTPAKRAELDRRLADLAAAPEDGVPWDQVEAAALDRFAR